jgi:hypothetical protein
MDMNSYIDEIEFAATSLIQIIWKERDRMCELEEEIASLSKVVETEYHKAQSWGMNAEDPEDVAMALVANWNNYFGDDKDLYHKNKSRQDLEDDLCAHKFSVAALCGALLQLAKQGISLVHVNLANCPSGRAIGSQQHIKDVIWYGRNQAIHWEDGKFHKSVEVCFNALSADIDARFSQYRTRSMASDVVELLDWKSLDAFKTDLLQLA